jgi:phosphoserine aminotransferase
MQQQDTKRSICMKIYNFAAGPAMLPEAVMKKAQSEFCAF